jgi:alpha-mannosidase
MELAQCIGDHEWSYALYPHTGDWAEGGVYDQAEDLNLPLQPAQAGPHEGDLPKAMSFVELQGKNLQLTALKRAEDRKTSWIARIFNPGTRAVNGKLILHKPVKDAWLTNLDEKRLEKIEVNDAVIPFRAGKKKIVTLEFRL